MTTPPLPKILIPFLALTILMIPPLGGIAYGQMEMDPLEIGVPETVGEGTWTNPWITNTRISEDEVEVTIEAYDSSLTRTPAAGDDNEKIEAIEKWRWMNYIDKTLPDGSLETSNYEEWETYERDTVQYAPHPSGTGRYKTYNDGIWELWWSDRPGFSARLDWMETREEWDPSLRNTLKKLISYWIDEPSLSIFQDGTLDVPSYTTGIASRLDKWWVETDTSGSLVQKHSITYYPSIPSATIVPNPLTDPAPDPAEESAPIPEDPATDPAPDPSEDPAPIPEDPATGPSEDPSTTEAPTP